MRGCAAGLVLVTLAACVPALPTESSAALVTAFPTLDPGDPVTLCAAVDVNWNNNWPRAIEVLSLLVEQGVDCAPDQPSAGKLYAARFNYGQALAAAGQEQAAIDQYTAALRLNPGSLEAVEALRVLSAYTPPPPLTCTASDVEAAYAALPPYESTFLHDFVTIEGDRFLLGQALYFVQGVNYYPARAPWRRFLTAADLADVRYELGLLASTGFNTLRLFLWHEALFTCPGNGAVPVMDAFVRLDAIIREAAAHGFRLILTLNDLPDLTINPLYEQPSYVADQIVFLVERYRDEGTILAWDLRNEGDVDYRPVGEIGGGFAREEVLAWLAETSVLVRAHDENHLVTAGWFRDTEATIPFVDVVSLHHWDTAEVLRDRVARLQSLTDKPILLEEFGYSTFQHTEAEQGRLLRETIQAAEYDGLSGWLIWTAFDFSTDVTCVLPACPSEDSMQHHFGIWGPGYTPKLARGILAVLIEQGGVP